MHKKSTEDRCLRFTYKRAHKPEETGVPSKMHPMDKTRAHLSASQRKIGLGGRHLGPAEPLGWLNPDGLPSRCALAGDSILSSRRRCPHVSFLILAGTDLLG